MGFANFYRRFILRFSKVVRFITDMLIGMVKGKKTGEFHWLKKADDAFGMLKDLFTIALILRMFDLSFRTRMETDVSGFALNAVISQFFSDLASMRNEWHPITF
jgi:hypothetical protein